MLKKINWKAIGKGFAWAVCLSGVIILMSFIEIKKQEVKCTNVKILIPGADNFIEREEIDAILKQSQGNLVGKTLEAINTHEIEKAIQANPYIAFAKVYADMDGVINIQIKQRQPVLRIINAGGQDYYIDKDGLKMPMSSNFTANVLVATGDIFEGYGGKVDTLMTPLVADLYKAALFLKQDTLWDAQIEQMFVNTESDIELIPRVGNQRIILGNADSLAVKMGNLLAFYKQAMPQVGWDAYKTINIKYINQIICEKNIFDPLAPKKSTIALDSAAIAKKLIDSSVQAVIKEEIKAASAVKTATTVKTAAAVKATTPDKTVKKETETAPVKKVVTPVPLKETKSTATAEPKKAPAKTPTSTKVDAPTSKPADRDKVSVKTDPTLYKPPTKSTVEKEKATAINKEKTNTKKQR